jgi:hypothetical protein
MDEFVIDVKAELADYKHSISKVMDLSSFSGRQVNRMLAEYDNHLDYVNLDIANDEEKCKISFHKSKYVERYQSILNKLGKSITGIVSQSEKPTFDDIDW